MREAGSGEREAGGELAGAGKQAGNGRRSSRLSLIMIHLFVSSCVLDFPGGFVLANLSEGLGFLGCFFFGLVVGKHDSCSRHSQVGRSVLSS